MEKTPMMSHGCVTSYKVLWWLPMVLPMSARIFGGLFKAAAWGM
jgi:hypothetical protein